MRNPLVHVVASLFVLAQVACGSTSPQSALGYNGAAIELENGGVDTTDEAPAFGDPVIASEETEDHSEGTVTDAEDQNAIAAGAKVYYLAIAWGRLRFAQHPALAAAADFADGGPGTPTLWDGKLCASGDGVNLRLLRKVKFELATDSVVSRGPGCIEWKSQTLPRWDGILARVVVLPTAAADASLSFTTAPYSTTLAVSELAGLHRIAETGDANGDRVAFVAVEGRVPCRVGFTDGRWMQLDDRGGVFMGRWVNRDGTLVGHVRGLFGVRRDSSHVLFGKIIDSDGVFIGRLRGTFGDGFFRGTFEGREGAVHGVVFGRFNAEAAADARGMYRGVWAAECATRPGSCACTTDSSTDDVAPCACADVGQ